MSFFPWNEICWLRHGLLRIASHHLARVEHRYGFLRSIFQLQAKKFQVKLPGYNLISLNSSFIYYKLFQVYSKPFLETIKNYFSSMLHILSGQKFWIAILNRFNTKSWVFMKSYSTIYILCICLISSQKAPKLHILIPKKEANNSILAIKHQFPIFNPVNS